VTGRHRTGNCGLGPVLRRRPQADRRPQRPPCVV